MNGLSLDRNPFSRTRDFGILGLNRVVSFNNAKSFKLDGVDEFIDLGDPVSGLFDFGASSFTLSAWIKKDNLTTQGVIFGKYETVGDQRSYLLRTDNTNGQLVWVDVSAGDVIKFQLTSSTTNAELIAPTGNSTEIPSCSIVIQRLS